MSVSVLTMTYNQHKDLLDRSVSASVEHGADQVVVVDDGSAEPVVNSWGPKVKVVRLDKNVGITKAFNAGLPHLTGDYVCRVMSDDYVLPGKFQSQVEFMERHLFGACFTDSVDTNGDERKVEYKTFRKKLCTDNLFYGGTTMIRRDVLNQYGGHPDWLVWAQDWWLHLWVEFKGCGWSYLPGASMVQGVYESGHTKETDRDEEQSMLRNAERIKVAKHWQNAWRYVA